MRPVPDGDAGKPFAHIGKYRSPKQPFAGSDESCLFFLRSAGCLCFRQMRSARTAMIKEGISVAADVMITASTISAVIPLFLNR